MIFTKVNLTFIVIYQNIVKKITKTYLGVRRVTLGTVLLRITQVFLTASARTKRTLK